MVTETIPEAALVELLRGMLENQRVLAEACGVELPFVADGRVLEQLGSMIANDRTKRGGIVLPLTLRTTMLHAEAFDAAVAKGYIAMTDDGHLAWMLGSTTLLAYFLGRLFSGDYGWYSKGKGGTVWIRGKKAFPATELQQLFGVKTLRKLRENRDSRLLPENFELIDKLFGSPSPALP